MSTKQHQRYWKTRIDDWKTAYFDTKNHPHRDMIISYLRKIAFGSLLEVGCNTGPNLYRIAEAFPQVETGGLDINAGAIEMARNLLPTQVFTLDIGPADDIPHSDKSSDVVLTDACLMYIGPDKIDKVMKEIVRVARRYVFFFEPHCESAWQRFLLRNHKKNYYAHDYKKLLEKHGFWDIELYKMPPELWKGEILWERWGYLIVGRI